MVNFMLGEFHFDFKIVVDWSQTVQVQIPV